MRALSSIALAASALAVAACTSTYHPEYHPVTVTRYEQHVTSSPMNGDARAAPVAAPGPTLVVPTPPPPYPPPPWSAWPSE
jgi:hypothetical protein